MPVPIATTKDLSRSNESTIGLLKKRIESTKCSFFLPSKWILSISKVKDLRKPLEFRAAEVEIIGLITNSYEKKRHETGCIRYHQWAELRNVPWRILHVGFVNYNS